MNLMIILTTMLLSLSISGCGKQDQQARSSDPVALKTQLQLETLDKAKQVEGMLLDSAAHQRKIIAESSHSQE
jgi:hypothetical protein